MDIIAIIPAGGMNSRYNDKISKLTEHINEKTVIEHSIDAFLHHPAIKQIIVPCNTAYLHNIKDLIPNDPKVLIVDGGPSRAESVKNGFSAISIPCTNVIIHDAARPNINPTLIDRLINASQMHPIVIPGVPVTDTIKEVEQNKVSKTIL